MKKDDFGWRDLFKTLWYFLDDKKAKYIFWSLLIALGSSFTIIVPLLVGKIIDFFTTYSPEMSLAPFYIYACSIGLVFAVSSVMGVYAKRKVNEIKMEVVYNIRSSGFDKLSSLSLSWHENETSGAKIQKIREMSSSVSRFIGIMSNKLIQIFITFIGAAVIFIYLSRSFLVFFFVYVLAFILIGRGFDAKLKDLNMDRNKAAEKASGAYYEATSNILSIKSLGLQKSVSKRVADKESETKSTSLKLMKHRIVKDQVLLVLNSVAVGIFFVLLGANILSGLLTVGFIAVYYSYFKKIKQNLWVITDVIPELIEIKTRMERGYSIFREKEDKYFGNGRISKDWSKVLFQDVSFAYGKEDALRDVSLFFKRGDKVGVVGGSGSGKSTVSKILLGLYKINSGSIRIDNRDYYEFSHDEVLKKISCVLQETELFNLSLKENITLMKNYDKKLLNKAIKVAQLESVVRKLPDGVDTLIGEKGYKLSGGERQRIGIARALYKNSDVIIFDEATSSLDSRTEMKIQKGIECMKDKTMLIIAHRLSTLKNVDKIWVFDKGKMVEQGNFSELVKDKKSKFYKLWEKEKKKLK